MFSGSALNDEGATTPRQGLYPCRLVLSHPVILPEKQYKITNLFKEFRL